MEERWEPFFEPYLKAWMVRVGKGAIRGLHKFDMDEETARLLAEVPNLQKALERIANHEVRSDRRHRGMVDVGVVADLQRIAKEAIKVVKP